MPGPAGPRGCGDEGRLGPRGHEESLEGFRRGIIESHTYVLKMPLYVWKLRF